MSESSDETRPVEPDDPSGGTPSSSPTQPVEPAQDQPSGQRPYPPPTEPFSPPGQSFSPPGRQGIEPFAGVTQPVAEVTQPVAGVAQGGVPGVPQRPAASPATRDRLVVPLIWEGLLLLIAIGLVREAFVTAHQAHFDAIFGAVGYTGLVASGLALSLRTATPNLAVGSIASATGVVGAHLAASDGWSLWAAMTLAVAIAALVGLIAGLTVAALSVPAWAATLGLAVLVQAAALGITHGAIIPLHVSAHYPTALWLTVFAVVSIGGGVLWLVPGIRNTFSATRAAREPGQWAGLRAGLGAVVGLTGSSLLAGVGGVAMATFVLAGDPESGGINLTFIALAAVLFGGVSVFGRRAGVFGTVLGVVIVSTIFFLMNYHAVSPYWADVPIGGLAVLGLAVSRAEESMTDALNQPPAPGIFPPAGAAGPPPAMPPGAAS